MAITKPPVLPVWADSGDKVQPSDVEITTGWPLSNVPPSRQRFNWFFNFVMNAVRYFSRRGLPDWDSAETYSVGDCTIGPDNKVYRALTGNINKSPDSNPSDWSLWITGIDDVPGRLIGTQVLTSTGTYNPTPGTASVVVTLLGGGGGGGGTPAAPAGQSGGGGGGGGGAFAKARYTSGFAGITVTIGAGGAGAVNSAGAVGGGSSFGALLSVGGGNGGPLADVNASFPHSTGGGSGGSTISGSGITESGRGPSGGASFVVNSTNLISGDGGDSYLGGGAYHIIDNSPGVAASTKGSGGSGAGVTSGQPNQAGGNGAPGVCVVYEYS